MQVKKTVLVSLSLSAAITALMGSQNMSAQSPTVGVDEILTYECARGVATLVEASEQSGPVFSQGELVFASIAARDSSAILIVSAGAGVFSIPLEHTGVNKMRFELPSGRSAKPQVFFLNYLHDPGVRSRVFEFSMMRPPVGKTELDYRLVQPQRATYLQPHLEYAIWETSSGLLSSLTEGGVRRDQVNFQDADCTHLERRAPALARVLQRNLDELHVMVQGLQTAAKPAPPAHANSRMPASVSSN